MKQDTLPYQIGVEIKRNNMEHYSIYCTAEQTKKALILHAPIKHWGNTSNLITPTAEQMIGWLEEQRIFIHIDYDFSDNDKPYKCEMCLFNGMTNHRGWFISRKEATLDAIDAALDYLIKNKK